MLTSFRVSRICSRLITVRNAASPLRIIQSSMVTFEDDQGLPDPKLRNDIKIIGQMLGNSIQEQDKGVYDAVESLRILGREWRKPDGDKEAFQKMVDSVKTYDAAKLHGVSRAFSNFLALANSAENHHRIRRLKSALISSNSQHGLWPKDDSCAGAIHNLVTKESVSKEAIMNALKTQKVEIVLTAHPTEVNRRTILQKHKNIKEMLDQMDRTDIPNYDRNKLISNLRGEISSIWESDDLRRSKPSPVDEAKGGLFFVENILWNAVPNFLRKLDDVTRSELNERLPLDIPLIRLASWMGGDRDGNPNVTPEITFEVSMLSRWMAATLFKADIQKLRSSLSLRTASEELKKSTNHAREPYRELLKQVINRLQATISWTNNELLGNNQYTYSDEPYKLTKELLDPLMLIHRSLIETKKADVADGNLTDIIRRVVAFGLSLMPLDLRQESSRHTEALDAITRHLGVGSYAQWDETTRRNWLLAELSARRPLLPKRANFASLGFSPTVVDTLSTFELAAKLPSESLGAYVISQCQQASDVMAVLLLQQDAGVNPALRVVPLFETLDDLERSAATIEALFGMPGYRGRIGNKQEIMVGYSDSAKDAGRLAAAWEQYKAQMSMVDVAKRFGVEVTFFHGKGGTVGRGGNPALFQAILAHPPNTINGRFRVTEQGEMINQNFGQEPVAERTLDLFTAGVLADRFSQQNPKDVKKEWKVVMSELAQISCEAYRKVVRGEPRFVPYFRSATPELELSGLNVGSRPAKRNPKGGVESLRAIPWVFAWTQTRLNLPTWLGVGDALSAKLSENPAILREMYSHWPWFRTLIDLLEMILVKSDERIAQNYDEQLVSDPSSIQLGKELRDKLTVTSESVLSVSQNPQLQSNNPLLLKSLAVRNPYIDPLNVIQAELLRRLRSHHDDGHKLSEEEVKMLQDALLITINGIANGMRNSG
eukprot:gene15244-20546_t